MLATLLAAAAGLAVWAVDRGADSSLLPADAPGWARFRDHLLEGPDAGAWAANAAALWLDRASDLDAHRLPILPRLIAFVLELQARPDPALAGHLVNHLLHVALGPVVYLLGRRWMGRGLALGAALAAVSAPSSVLAAERYGVDPLVTLALPLALLAAEGAAVWWRLAPVFGIVVGLCASAHLTTIGIGVPALLLALFRGGPGFRRWFGALGLAAGTFIGVGLAFHDYPTLPWGVLTGSIAEGVAPGSATSAAAAVDGPLTHAVAVVRAGGPAALERAIGFLISSARPSWLPWAAALWLPWLGVVGWGHAAPRHPATRRFRRLRAWVEPLRGLGAGLPLAAALVPILAFAAADSPPRYTANYLPLGLLLVFRGMAMVVRLVERPFERWLPTRAKGALGLVVGLAAVAGLWPGERVLSPLRLPPSRLEVADWRLGAAIAASFPPGGGASCLRREAAAYASRIFCPYSQGYIYERRTDPVRTHLDAECGGEGPIPYVILSGIADGATDQRRRMDAWVEANGALIDTLATGQYEARIYAVERPASP